jgi:hypothetical protein
MTNGAKKTQIYHQWKYKVHVPDTELRAAVFKVSLRICCCLLLQERVWDPGILNPVWVQVWDPEPGLGS